MDCITNHKGVCTMRKTEKIRTYVYDDPVNGYTEKDEITLTNEWDPKFDFPRASIDIYVYHPITNEYLYTVKCPWVYDEVFVSINPRYCTAVNVKHHWKNDTPVFVFNKEGTQGEWQNWPDYRKEVYREFYHKERNPDVVDFFLPEKGDTPDSHPRVMHVFGNLPEGAVNRGELPNISSIKKDLFENLVYRYKKCRQTLCELYLGENISIGYDQNIEEFVEELLNEFRTMLHATGMDDLEIATSSSKIVREVSNSDIAFNKLTLTFYDTMRNIDNNHSYLDLYRMYKNRDFYPKEWEEILENYKNKIEKIRAEKE